MLQALVRDYYAKSIEFVSTFVSLRSCTDFYEYNGKTTPYLYSVMYKLCLASAPFREHFMNHSNFVWGLRYLYFESDAYPKVHEVMTKIFEFVLEDANTRLLWINYLIEWNYFQGRQEKALRYVVLLFWRT